MGIERTPDEQAADDAADARIAVAMDRATEDLASLLVAMTLDIDPDACERLVNQLYDGLREALSPEDRLRALVTELSMGARERAAELISQFRELPERGRSL